MEEEIISTIIVQASILYYRYLILMVFEFKMSLSNLFVSIRDKNVQFRHKWELRLDLTFILRKTYGIVYNHCKE